MAIPGEAAGCLTDHFPALCALAIPLRRVVAFFWFTCQYGGRDVPAVFSVPQRHSK